MKKTFLTLAVLGFGASVAFAQSTDIDAQPQDATQMEQTQSSDVQAVQEQQRERTEVKMAELPSAVQEAFENGEYSDMEVLAIYLETPEESTEATVFEFELAEKAGEASATAMEGVETETVSNRQPDVILQIDENGEVVEEKTTEEM